jgi:hypothetical protein
MKAVTFGYVYHYDAREEDLLQYFDEEVFYERYTWKTKKQMGG